ncbi:MAG: hypothetical protein OIN66_06520 [Candidatus Methanoperedens sp.]|nr:hypothetical protein [Candidatus Methanoperedens sp.]
MVSCLTQKKNKTVEMNLFEFSTEAMISSENLTEKPEIVVPGQMQALSEIGDIDFKLSQHFQDKFIVQSSLTRQLVSFQANKKNGILSLVQIQGSVFRSSCGVSALPVRDCFW